MTKYMFEPFGGCFVGQTRDECISKCIVNHVIEKTGKYPPNYLTNNRNSSLLFVYSSKVNNISHIVKKCQIFCDSKTECSTKYFDTYPSFSGGNQNYIDIIVQHPAHPNTIYEINLKMCVEEYLCLMSSIFSLWFGFSILMFTDFCRLLFTKIKIYFQTYNINRIQNTFNIYTRPRSLVSAPRQFLH